MRLIDADALKSKLSGASVVALARSEIWGLIDSAPTVRQTCELPKPGDIVFNTNNQTYGVLICILDDKSAAQILEVGSNRVFVNCPPLAALEKTGAHMAIRNEIMKLIGPRKDVR